MNAARLFRREDREARQGDPGPVGATAADDDLPALLESAAKALSGVADGTEEAISKLRFALSARRSKTGLTTEELEEADLVEALLRRSEAARSETLRLVAVIRRARANLGAAPGGVVAAARVLPRPTEREAIALRTAPQAATRPPVPAPAVPTPPQQAPAPAPVSPQPPPVPGVVIAGSAAREAGNEIGEGALLLATQMAVAGSSREEIEVCLTEFGVTDVGAVVDRVFQTS